MPTIHIEDDGTGCTGILVGRDDSKAPQTYFETLGEALAAWYSHLNYRCVRGHRGLPDQSFDEFASRWEAMSYETSQQRCCGIIKDGKLHSQMVISIYRMQSGRYEVTAYLS